MRLYGFIPPLGAVHLDHNLIGATVIIDKVNYQSK
jgi:hypothetical protein